MYADEDRYENIGLELRYVCILGCIGYRRFSGMYWVYRRYSGVYRVCSV